MTVSLLIRLGPWATWPWNMVADVGERDLEFRIIENHNSGWLIWVGVSVFIQCLIDSSSDFLILCH
jgi:hypothetical protein